MRHGFSLVEALVALALFQIAMLALAASTAVAARDLADAARRTRATSLARNGVQLMLVTACADAVGVEEVAHPNAYIEHRRRSVAAAGRRELVDSVVYAVHGNRDRAIVLRTWAFCPPPPP
ncbi:MAG TPA: prepilin-type N-terminal cleavage/methylation domain-containing protein [Gemmatimonadaceae bacterium]|nr:prepilin-type N-terminal cleavage/methylation domain-containing protein [Gemmatimonadaceae bacterium]